MDVFKAIQFRRSIRSYQSDSIPDALLEHVTEALRLAPSACNNQPWRFILVRDAGLRRRVAQTCQRQMFIAEAPIVVVGCALTEQAYPRMGGYWSSAEVDVAIALDHLTLAAAAEGLGTCWIGAFDEAALKRILAVPEQAKIVALTPLGYPASPGMFHPPGLHDRKPRSAVFSEDQF